MTRLRRRTPRSLGRLDSRVTIQQKSHADGDPDIGGDAETWTLYKKVWASVDWLSGMEYLTARQIKSKRAAEVEMHYVSGVVETMRLVLGWYATDALANTTTTRKLEIESTSDVQERGNRLLLQCREWAT